MSKATIRFQKKIARGRPPTKEGPKTPYPSMLIYDVPPKLRMAFKAKCAEKGITLCRQMKLMMQEFIDKTIPQ
jgi:hypothetical protein